MTFWASFILGYIATMVIAATVFTIRNSVSKHNIAERYIFWMLFPVGIVALVIAKIFNFRMINLWDRIKASAYELYKF